MHTSSVHQAQTKLKQDNDTNDPIPIVAGIQWKMRTAPYLPVDLSLWTQELLTTSLWRHNVNRQGAPNARRIRTAFP
jgi:hypothetical protein